MERDRNSFELDFKEGKIFVKRHSVGGQTMFRITFSDKRNPLIITRAIHANSHHFWTSIPEGRQKEAEEAGILISEFYKTIQ